LGILGSFLLVTIAVGGSYIGYLFWVKYHSLQSSQDRLKQELVLKETRLNRLENLEKFLNSYDPERLQALLSMQAADNATLPAAKDGQDSTEYVDVDQGVVRFSNLNIAPQGETIKIHFRILNADGTSGSPASGHVGIQLIGPEGTAIHIHSDTIQGGTSYRIRRFKDMDLQVPLPAGTTMRDIVSVRLLAMDSEETLVLSRTVEFNS
jgi:hypothetical protein